MCDDAGRVAAVAGADREVARDVAGLFLDEFVAATISILTRGFILTFFLCIFCRINIGGAGIVYEEISTGLVLAESKLACPCG
jgi:hypothetical protein